MFKGGFRKKSWLGGRLCLVMVMFVLSQFISLIHAPIPHASDKKTESAIFAGGCFWCVESDFDKVPGVILTTSGYIGGTVENPTYEQVSQGGTGHFEVVKIDYDPQKVTYEKLLYYFWRLVDPTDAGGQFCDRGDSYKTAIFATSEDQLKAALTSKEETEKNAKIKIVTDIKKAGPFYKAEEYHQDYYNKNPIRYKYYRYSCGRDARVKDLWKEQARGGLEH